MNVWIVMGLLGLWLALTLLYQLFLHGLRPYVRRFDIFWVIPAYRFFEEFPDDFVLSYRNRLSNATESGWQDIHTHRPTGWYTAVWHPQFIQSDTIQLSMQHFAEMLACDEPLHMEQIQSQFPYLALLRHVLTYPVPPEAKTRQFRISRAAENPPGAPETAIFLSAYHDL